MFRRIKLVAAALMALSAAFVGSGAGIAATATPDYEAIDAYVSRSLAGAPGVSLAIVHGDQVVHVKGFGIADGDRAQVTPDTPFVIGSQTKSFTALAIMQLSERGRSISMRRCSATSCGSAWQILVTAHASRSVTCSTGPAVSLRVLRSTPR